MHLVVIRRLALIVERNALNRAGRVTCCCKLFSRIDMLRIRVTPTGINEVSCKGISTHIRLYISFKTGGRTRDAHPSAIFAIANGANIEIIGSLTRKTGEGIVKYVRSLNLGSSLEAGRIKFRCAGNKFYIVADGVVNKRPLNLSSLSRSTCERNLLDGLIIRIFTYGDIINVGRTAVLIIAAEEESLISRSLNEEAIRVPSIA